MSKDFKRSRLDADLSAEGNDTSNSEILKAVNEMDSRLSSTLHNDVSIISGGKEESHAKLETVSALVNSRLQAVDVTIAQLGNRCNCGNWGTNVISGAVKSSENGNNNFIVSRLNQLERESLINELIVTGVPLEKRRSVDDIVADICDALLCDLRRYDFDAIFRVSSRQQNNQVSDEASLATTSPPILLRFNYLWARNYFLDAYYKKKNLNLKDIGFKTAKRVYVNENLTALDREIFKTTLQVKKSGKIKRCFTWQGVVYIQETETSNVVRVTSKLDLAKFLLQHDSKWPPHKNMDQN